ncbi:hypothetical protein [Bradyrhizobium canariense]|uniref:hypothetical protein n=1 Tax=Bradyrhizobium canariense TaxID=255045 RepID=UPI001B89F375|nr:hypothetical protein [Bradyrhizobium canariense]MBR0954924.1 hypothetical protein [Bradyrhizobium canariense]
MICKIRLYEPPAGKAEGMRERFKAPVAPRLARHGIELIGVFEPTKNDGNLTYISRFHGKEQRGKG